MIKTRNILILFFISGFTALVFEVVWAKQACLIFGNTTLASAAVIAAFMTGLALGSHLFGKVADKHPKSSLRLYALLEGGIGLFALCFPFLIRLLVPVYKAVYLSYYDQFLKISMIRFALSFFVLIFPTTLMGGTLPLLSRYLCKNADSMKENISKLYSMNLFGAMTGSFVSGFIMISAFGLYASSFIAASLNLGIFFYMTWHLKERKRADSEGLSGQAESVSMPLEEGNKLLDKKTIKLIIGLMLIHGFNAFVIQICWTRTMGLVLGSSTYAFSAVLVTFLAGLGLGTYAISRIARKQINISLGNIGFMEIAVGASVLLFVPVFEWLIYFFVKIFPIIQSSVLLVFMTQFIFCAVAMIVPTFLMGLVFPATLAYLGNPKSIGRIVGTTYAANTLGGVLGCFFAAFFFISNFGIIGSLRMVSFLSMIVGFVVVLAASERLKLKSNAVKATLAVVVSSFLFFYSWDMNMFSSGVFIYAASWGREISLSKTMLQKAMGAGKNLIYYKDGISSTISVLQYDLPGSKSTIKAKSLRVNGKTDASTIGDMATQLYLGYIPLFAHPEPKEVLVIGLGAGVTLGTVTQFPSVQHIECVEIEPAVIEANRYFTVENNYALQDPRVKLIVGDGRNHISFGSKKYDVIISEPSNPWISGVSNLFSQENYRSALDKLNPDGIYCQWFHAYQMSKEDYVMIMNTFASVFPQVNLFKVGGSDYFMLGSKKKISFDYQKMMQLIESNSYIKTDLKYFSEHAENFILGAFLLSDRDLRMALSKERPHFNTDDHLALEYNAPKYLYKATTAEISQWLYSIHRQDLFPYFYDGDKEKILNDPALWNIFYIDGINALQAKNYDDALSYLKEAMRLNPDELRIKYVLGRVCEAKKQYSEAMKYYQMLEGTKAWGVAVKSAIQRAKIREAMDKNPILNRDVKLHNLIAGLSFSMGDMEETLRSMNIAINLDPNLPENYGNLAMFCFRNGYETEGVALLKKGERLNPNDPSVIRARKIFENMSKNRGIQWKLREGVRYLSLKDFLQAKRCFDNVISEDPGNYLAYIFLADSEAGLGLKEAAERHRAKAVELRQKYESEKKASEKIQEVKKDAAN